MTSQSASSAEFTGVYCDTKHTKFINKMQFLYVTVFCYCKRLISGSFGDIGANKTPVWTVEDTVMYPVNFIHKPFGRSRHRWVEYIKTYLK
jgi:hypothetical protein